MLTGKLVRVRHARTKLVPSYIDVMDREWREVAEHLLLLYRDFVGKTRAEIEAELAEAIGDLPTQLVHQGLAKLLLDRCEFEVDTELNPDEIREQVFLASGRLRQAPGRPGFDRDAILTEVATALGTTPDQIDLALFADLKSEQRIKSFDDCSVDFLLNRYNVALAQSILMRATKVTITVRDENQIRYRYLFRMIKFFRLIATVKPLAPGTFEITLDGPLSLFSSTQKYGVQLANFLGTILKCERFALKAEIRWGAERKEKFFHLDPGDSLRPYTADYANYDPPELAHFVDAFTKLESDWTISRDAPIPTFHTWYWLPDYLLTHTPTGYQLPMEVMGYWRKSDLPEYYEKLKRDYSGAFILAASEQYNTDEEAPADPGPGFLFFFKRTLIPGDILKRANQILIGQKI